KEEGGAAPNGIEQEPGCHIADERTDNRNPGIGCCANDAQTPIFLQIRRQKDEDRVVNSLYTDTQQGGRKSACTKIRSEKTSELSLRFPFIGLALTTDLRGVLRGASNNECR